MNVWGGGFWLWEARSVVFYEGLRLGGEGGGGTVSHVAVRLGGSARGGPHARGGSELG